MIPLQKFLGVEDDGIFGRGTEKAVVEFQRAYGLDTDGMVGPNTWSAVLAEADKSGSWAHHFPLMFRIMEWVAWVETGGVADSFGFAEGDIGDGAGANYGVIQYNSRGSMRRLLKAYAPSLYHDYAKDPAGVVDDVRSWMRSQEGIKAQVSDFKIHIYDRARSWIQQRMIVDQASADMENCWCELADMFVQHGSATSPYRTPDWCEYSKWVSRKELPPQTSEAALLVMREKPEELGDPLSDNEAILETFLDLAYQRKCPAWSVGLIIGLLRGSCSKPKYADAVLHRRWCIGYGRGTVHGSEVSMYDDFGIGGLP